MAKRRGEIENGDVNGKVKVKKPRMKWTDDLHQSFLDAVAILGGEDNATPKMISYIMRTEGVTMLNIKSHLQMYRNLRQRHLVRGVLDVSEDNEKKKQVFEKINDVLDHPAPRRHIKEVIAKNTLENHLPPILESNNIVVTVHMPGEEGQKPHAYLIVGDLVNPSTTQAKRKGKEKMAVEDYHQATKQFYEKLAKNSRCSWTSSLKLGIN